MTAKLLFIDDDPLVLSAFRRSLEDRHPEWQADFIACPLEAWERVQRQPYDTIVVDMKMPHMTGLEFLVHVKSNPATRAIPVVIVTGSAASDDKRKALDYGAADLLNKPVSADDLDARIRSSLKLRYYEQQLEKQSELLARQVSLKTAELSASRLEIIWRLAKASEYRDEDTGNHVIRVGAYSRILAKRMGLSADFCDTIFHAAPLHDLGKLGIPDSVLLKPGKLNDEEWRVMKTHCQIGVSILNEECKLGRLARTSFEEDCVAASMSQDNPFLSMASDIARSHHERWDGAGYPHGLAASQIPLAARIVALSDVYDALRSRRPYKEQASVDQAVSIIIAGTGSHFDPQVVQAFLDGLELIRATEISLGDFHNGPTPAKLPLPALGLTDGESYSSSGMAQAYLVPMGSAALGM